ncbi:MAG: right-handed parallel beta-helix repeat-containing protein, partial [Phycisphaerales bacterium]
AMLDVSDTASGTFEICLSEDTLNRSFLIDCATILQIEEFAFACLTVTVPLGDCDHGPDCNGNGRWDICDLYYDDSIDCNRNDIPDECDITGGESEDCNENYIPDECDLEAGTSEDCGSSGNGIPDECEPDCDGDGTPDSCDLAQGMHEDCNENGVPDQCDITDGTSSDCEENGNNIPDECETDCNENGVADSCDIAVGTSFDDDENTIPDECQHFRRVPGEYTTIQDAVDDSLPGDVVVLADGIYRGEGNVDVYLDGRLLTLRSESGPENCIIQTDEDERGIYLVDGEDYRTRIEGIRFVDTLVGVTVKEGSSPRIEGCVFEGNYIAVLAAESSPTIRGCTVSGSTGDGSVYFTQRSLGTLSQCRVVENEGAGVVCWSSDATIRNCVILDNGGVGIYCSNSDSHIGSCLIARNGPMAGGGIRCRGGTPLIYNCTITDNWAFGGSAIYSSHRSSPRVVSSIVWQNEWLFEMSGVVVSDKSTLEMVNSDVEYGAEGILRRTDGKLKWRRGNIALNPRFIGGEDAEEAYQLLPHSPCINTGDQDFVGDEGETDVAGRDRVMFGVVDMGAYEADAFADCNWNTIPDSVDVVSHDSEDCNANGIPDECDLSTEASTDCNANGIPDECDAKSGADCDGDEVPDECQVDDDGDGVINECDGCPVDARKTDPGLCGCGVDETDNDGDAVPDCTDRCPGFDDRVDCNENDEPDGCDIAEGMSKDRNQNGIPDECERVTVRSVGGRYLAITPFESQSTVALRVSGEASNPSIACVSLYVQEDGGLGSEPVFRWTGEWGTVHVTGEEIVPSEIGEEGRVSSVYGVQADVGVPGDPVLSFAAKVSPWLWGDVNNDGVTDDRDVEAVLDGLGGEFEGTSIQSLDLAPCDPDGILNISDLQYVLKAVGGQSFRKGVCPAPCR